ncbi:Six-hairpin glycosidase [Trichodelitschia bisporula]|uniref:cellulase n=1 Tax=Trichodelitschia bisporula TaxID=703511 RepID=A0A6G1HPR6_9PEZI|nr:Six-hairpin glycosidase [Trichodelitschia bisporula]
MHFNSLQAVLLLALLPHTLGQVEPTRVYLPPPATSATAASDPSNPVNEQWNNILGNALYFFDIQRSGRLPENFRVDWRNDSVLADGSDVGLDLSGGFFDAGNYIKATLPLCWVVTQLSWGAAMFGRGFDAADQTAYLDETLRTGLDWLLEASSKDGELVVLIGNEDSYWGGDLSIPSKRPSFRVTRQKPGTDVFGSCASAFASASLLYNGTALPLSRSENGTVPSLKNSTYAKTLLDRGKSLFELAKTATPQQVYQKATDGVEWAYASSDFVDELVFSSTFLALATGDKTYADYAQQTYKSSGYPVTDGAVNWDQRAPATPFLLAQLALSQPNLGVDFSKYQSDTEGWMDRITGGIMSKTLTTKGGLFWFEGDSDAASLNPALNVATIMLMYSGLASSTSKSTRYRTFAQSQIDYVLGKNPMNVVYPAGTHPNSPKNPQSALASGGSDADNIDNDPPVEAHVLYGGVVGGPDKNDMYYDQRSDWKQTEVALDYQPPLLIIAAHQIATNASDPYYVKGMGAVVTPTKGGRGSGGEGGGLSTGAKVGIAVSIVVGVLLLAAIAFWKRNQILVLCGRGRSDKKIRHTRSASGERLNLGSM